VGGKEDRQKLAQSFSLEVGAQHATAQKLHLLLIVKEDQKEIPSMVVGVMVVEELSLELEERKDKPGRVKKMSTQGSWISDVLGQ